MHILRLHEIAKALSVTAKSLMAELADNGIVVKTHMAAADEKVLQAIRKKHSDLDSKLKEAESKPQVAEAPKPKKPKASKAGSKIVTQRTMTKKAAMPAQKSKEAAEADAPAEVEIVQRAEGSSGTVTMEQRVVREGVLRRRRVETPPPPQQTSSPSQAQAQAAPSATESSTAMAEPEIPATVETEVAEQAPSAAAETSPQSQQQVPQRRNLSAPSRLRIVDQPPIAPKRPAPAAAGDTSAAGAAQAKAAAEKKEKAKPREEGAAVEGETEEGELARKKEAHKKKPAVAAKVSEDHKPTKKDLLGMMEEVEITRPLGRRPKKTVQRAERKQTQITTPGASKRKIRIEDEITVADLAARMGFKASDIIRKLISMGQMATIQQKLDFETSSLIAAEYGYEVQNIAETAETVIQADQADEAGATQARAPIITVMGHVDHGKTSLLDYIRKSRVAAGEAGGITQHIGAYQIEHQGKKLTFIDTPGHAAFTSMRARGASLTDIVILVVAADEGVKPQTLEALAHAKAAKVPVIVGVNKIDKPEANPDRVMQELSNHGLVPEAWGGDTIYARISALTGQGVPELLELILLQSEMLDLKANPDRPAKGVVIESRLDKGKGPVATVIVQTGSLRVGHPIVSGTTFGKVRALFDDKGESIEVAGPSTPTEVLGFDAVPIAGEIVQAVSEDAIARKASELTLLARKKSEALKNSRMSLEDMYKKMQAGEVSELRVVLKGDVQGSLEAIADSLEKIKHEKVRVQILYKAAGAISESDVDLAAASGALIIGFNVRPTAQAKALAQRENVQIKTYEIIYELLDDVKLAMQGLLAPIVKENVLGQAEVREVFTVSKVGPVAGCFVKSGKIVRNAQGRLLRDNVVVYTAKIASLRRFKDDAREVQEGFECGIRLENFTDIKVGDIIECFEQVQMAQAVG